MDVDSEGEGIAYNWGRLFTGIYEGGASRLWLHGESPGPINTKHLDVNIH